MGHVTAEDGGGTIEGAEFGWPWTYRVEPFEYYPDLIRDVFRFFDGRNALANATVAMGTAFLAGIVWEYISRRVRYGNKTVIRMRS